MPYRENGSGNGGSCAEMEHGQGGSKAGILHAYLDGNGFDFGHIHTAGLGEQEADAVAQQIMAHDNHRDEESGFHNALGADRYHAASDENDGQNGDKGKDFDSFRRAWMR